MSAANVVTVTAPEAPSKVVPFHHHMAHEEQVKNTDQGNVAIAKARPRKHPLPASDLAKVPTTTFEQQLAELIQKFNALSPDARAAVRAKINHSLEKLHAELPILAKAMSGKTDATSTPVVKDGDNTFDPWNQSILMLYTAFAQSQMNQNGQIMNAWQAQQQAQNQTLEAAAAEEAKNVNTPLTSNQPSMWKMLLIGLGVLIGVALVCTGVGAYVGGAITATVIGASVGAGLLAGGATVGACYGAAQTHPDAPANGGLVENQPDQTLIQQMSFSNQFWSTISQKTNNQISSGSQTNVVNASSNDTQLGQQASQVIQAMGQVMQTPVAH